MELPERFIDGPDSVVVIKQENCIEEDGFSRTYENCSFTNKEIDEWLQDFEHCIITIEHRAHVGEWYDAKIIFETEEDLTLFKLTWI